MALLACTGCGGMVSENTDFCSQCGSLIEKKSKSSRLRFVALIILLPLVIVTIAAMNGGNALRSLTPDESETSPIRTTPLLGHKVRSLAIKKMRAHEVVVDAAINQEGDELSFLLIVAQGTSTAQAETLGSDFVQILESSIKETSKPEADFVSDRYSVLIGVYTPDQNRIAVAAKSRNESDLDW